MTAALPDLPKSVMDRLRADPDLFGSQWTNGRISGNWRNDWPSQACYAVLVLGDVAGGEVGLGVMYSDLPIICYGPDRRTARALWTVVHSVLVPMDGRPTCFHLAHCEVMTVALTGGPRVVPEPGTGWWNCYSVYRFLYGRQSVP